MDIPRRSQKNWKHLILCFIVTNFSHNIWTSLAILKREGGGHRNANASSENISPKCALYKGTLGFCCLAEPRRPCSCSHAQKQKLTCFISTTYPYLMHHDMQSFGRYKVSIFEWQLAVFAQYLQLNRYSARKRSKSALRDRSIFSSIMPKHYDRSFIDLRVFTCCQPKW